LPFDVGIQKNVSVPSLVDTLRSGIPQARAADTIGTGDEKLDKMLSVSGSDRNKILEWLNPGKRKGALKNLFQALPAINVNSNGLSLHDPHTRADYDRLQNNLNLLSEAIRRLEIV
jgi:hypothetical protein